MTWLRTRSRAVAMVALFAMVLQVACSFGHVHVKHLSGPPAFAKSFAIAKSEAVAPAAPAAGDIAATADPGAPPSGADGDVLCALCLVGHLVASAIAAAPPPLAVPVAYARLAPLQLASCSSSTAVLTSFWCRGPPTF